MPMISVGGCPTKCKWSELAAAIMPIGCAVKWTERDMLTEKTIRGTGLFEGSSWYDGVVAHLDVAGKRKYIHTQFDGSSVRRLKDTNLLCGPGIGGDGI